MDARVLSAFLPGCQLRPSAPCTVLRWLHAVSPLVTLSVPLCAKLLDTNACLLPSSRFFFFGASPLPCNGSCGARTCSLGHASGHRPVRMTFLGGFSVLRPLRHNTGHRVLQQGVQPHLQLLQVVRLLPAGHQQLLHRFQGTAPLAAGQLQPVALRMLPIAAAAARLVRQRPAVHRQLPHSFQGIAHVQELQVAVRQQLPHSSLGTAPV